ncbi:MAG: alpha/beta fold hydrolase [Candidatus Aenigmarchaeota archaeon]|nr:alpha/beta fold hydrolase [Candidatus Aenigmarchaeota archaeon]
MEKHQKAERKERSSGVTPYLIIALIIIVVETGFIAYLLAKGTMTVQPLPSPDNQQPPPPEPPPVTGPALRQTGDVEFTTSDGVIIKGTLSFPSEYKDAYPVVILVHQLSGSRHQWDSFAPTLLGQGYAVLAYDIRGMGESTMSFSNGQEVPYVKHPVDRLYRDSMIGDMRAALDFVLARQDIVGNRIAVMGASLGANIAYVSSGAYPEVKTSIALSAENTGGGALSGSTINNFNPHGIFFLSDNFEGPDARDLYSISDDPRKVNIYPGPSHGIGLLTKPEVVRDILEWLSVNS